MQPDISTRSRSWPAHGGRSCSCTRGHRRQPRPEDAQAYSIQEYADDTVTWIERHAGGPVDVLGHSHGGIVAARVAAEHPGLVRRLVLLGVPAYGGERAVSEAARLHRARLGEPACAAAMAALESQGDEYSSEADLGRLIAAVIPLWVGPMNERIRSWQAKVAAQPANVDALRYFNELVFPNLECDPTRRPMAVCLPGFRQAHRVLPPAPARGRP
ncbi:alpha/beta fold hydrolase [Plantactinospora sp. KBS50]|uniref:alpha/beta fold hydrolase n=1 Tax=Plantactinospora sp. KBS50 TaxID=2024580 RepID=UPI000BAACD69|nr:alpha/beta hydrolase [Plantactinospora sp. KBS50]ASW53878.1 hypothetical protein CIK06_06270 [Plantactinospora sp. KBS50]